MSNDQSDDSRQSDNSTFRWVAIGAAILLLGMLFGTSLLLYTAYSVFAVVAASLFLTKIWSSSPKAHRRPIPVEVEIGQTIPIEVEIENPSKMLIPWLLTEDLLPRSALIYKVPALAVDGARIQVLALAGSSTQTFSYNITCNRRGYYQIGPTVLETGDLMGLNRRYRVGADPQFLMVMPKVVPLEGYEIQSRRPIGEIRMTHQVMDDPTRIVGIRQWQPGDPMRRVHWSATARTGKLHSKIYEPSSIAGATLVLDLHVDTNPRQHEPMRSETAVTAAASICNALYQMKQPFGLVSNGRDAADRIRSEGMMTDYRTRDAAQQNLKMRDDDSRLRPVYIEPDRGPNQYRDTLRTLARLERTDGLSLADAILDVEPRLARDTSLVVILQQCNEPAAEVLSGLSRRGWAVSAIINTYDINDFSRTAGPLIAGGIETLHLLDESSIPTICRKMLAR